LCGAAAAALRAAGCPGGAELEVALVDDTTMAALNRRYLGHRGSTDVITFSGGGMPGDRALGEVVVSVERAREQARRAGWPVRCELALLVIHGILHLQGYDDMTPAAAAKMHARQDEILLRISRRWFGRTAGRAPARGR
jgi:probable rRNA maturation factor